MKTSLRRLAITVGIWVLLAFVLVQLPAPAWAIWVLNVLAGLTVIGILLEIREGGHREPDGFPDGRPATAAGAGEGLGKPRRFHIDASTTKDEAVSMAKAAARDHADSAASGSPRAAQRMLDAMPTDTGDLTAMAVFGGLPFDPRDTLVLPARPFSTELDELIREYEQTYIRTFSIRLRARLEAKSTRQEWLAQSRQSGRAAADPLPKRDRRRLLRQVRFADPEEWADVDPYEQAFLLGMGERIEELEPALPDPAQLMELAQPGEPAQPTEPTEPREPAQPLVHTISDLLEHLMIEHANDFRHRYDLKLALVVSHQLDLRLKIGTDPTGTASDHEVLPELHRTFDHIHRAIHRDTRAAHGPNNPVHRPRGDDGWKERARELALPTLAEWLAEGRLAPEDYDRWASILSPTENLAIGASADEFSTKSRLAWWMTVDRIAAGWIDLETADIAFALAENGVEVMESMSSHEESADHR